MGLDKPKRSKKAEPAPPPPNTGGRPFKYCEEIVTQICEIIAEGNPFVTAFTIAGIHEKTFATWRKQYPEFEQRVQEALQKSARERIGRIREAGKVSWQADAWWLERMVSEIFALKHKVEITDVSIMEHLGEILAESGLSEEQATALLGSLTARLKGANAR